MRALEDEATTSYLFGVYAGQEDGYHLFRLKDYSVVDGLVEETSSPELRRLDAYLVETLVFQQFLGLSCSDANREDYIAFAHADEEAVSMVNAGGYDFAFFVNPTRIEQVQEIVTQGEIMPQKSTYFYPKSLSGLVINQIDPEAIIP